MKIYFERSGGFTGIIDKRVIDVKSMTSKEQIQLRELVKNIKNMKLDKSVKKAKIEDSFQYHISIEEEDEKCVLETNEFQMNSDIRVLIDILEKKGQRK